MFCQMLNVNLLKINLYRRARHCQDGKCPQIQFKTSIILIISFTVIVDLADGTLKTHFICILALNVPDNLHSSGGMAQGVLSFVLMFKMLEGEIVFR